MRRVLGAVEYDSVRLLVGGAVAGAAYAMGPVRLAPRPSLTHLLTGPMRAQIVFLVAAALALSGLVPLLVAVVHPRRGTLFGKRFRARRLELPELDMSWGQPDGQAEYVVAEADRVQLDPSTTQRRWQATTPLPPRSAGDWPQY